MWWDTHMIHWNGKFLLKKGSGHDNGLRCLSDRLGSNQSESEVWRYMVPDREQDAYKLSGTASCNTSSHDILETQNQDVSTPQVGKYHGSGIHKHPKRISLQGVGRPGKEPVDVVSGEEHPYHSPTPNSRCRVSDYDRSVRPAAESSDYSAS